ncbi:MAG: hypothetical protein [Caudoviricetes sp.]|nr:MAG: hypothetical protein [Caudoviricetes sp.]
MNELFSQGGKGSTGILTNKQAVARHFGVKQSEVVYFSVGALLTGYKVIYDKASQRAYSLPADIGSEVTAVSLSPAGVLVHSAGSVDLGALAVAREEYVTLPGSFDTGVTVNTKNELAVFTDGKYRWDGALPKEVPTGSTPDATGGIGLGAWVSVGDASARQWAESYFMTPEYKKISGVTFLTGGSATANESALLNPLDNMYYSPVSGTITVPPSSSPDDAWVCVGYLSAYSVDDPRNYGAKPNVSTFDSSDALALWRDSIITRKRKTAYPTGREDPNMFNLGGAVFDMSQGAYYISRSFTIDNCLNFTVMNPSLIAIGSFPDTDAVLDFRKLSGTRPIENIVVFNPNIDANWKAASSIRITGDFLKVTVWGGLLTRYLQHGVKMQPNGSAPHELNMSKTHIFQQPDWRDPFPSHVTEGVGLDIDCYDNNFSDIIIGSQYKDVMILRKGANAFSNCHFYPDQDTDSTKGRVVIMSNADQFSNCYFDGCLIESNSDGARFTINACNWLVPPHGVAINLISNPYQVKITQCRFRNTTGTTMNDSVIKMKTLAEGRVSRPDIRNNYTENCTAISTSGREYFTLTSTEAARVVTRDIPDHFRPASSVSIMESSGNTNDDTWLLKARLISTNQVRMRPYNMTNLASTATYTGPVTLTYNTEND